MDRSGTPEEISPKAGSSPFLPTRRQLITATILPV